MIRRWVFNIAAVVSLLLWLASAAIWIASYRWDRTFGYTTFEPEGTGWRWRHWQCWLAPNRSGFIYQSNLANDVSYEQGWGYRPGEWFIQTAPAGSMPSITTTLFQRLCFSWQVRPEKAQFVVSGMEYRARVPFWAYIVVFSILPLRWMWKRRRYRRANECLVCSYNLTGNTSGVCPECGTPVSRRVAS